MAKRLAAVAMLIAFAISATPAYSSIASWYGPGFHGRKTANGEIYNQWAMTAAHKTLPFNTYVRVTYRGNSIVVRINDRGPYIRGRVIDLSKAAAMRLRCPGICSVKIEILGKRWRP